MTHCTGGRKIRIGYPQLVIDKWRSFSQEQKDSFNNLGKPRGFSGMNVLFFYMIKETLIRTGYCKPEDLFSVTKE